MTAAVLMEGRGEEFGVVAVVLILLMGLGLIYGQIRLRTVRSRLIRLQTEIARARRKPGEGAALNA